MYENERHGVGNTQLVENLLFTPGGCFGCFRGRGFEILGAWSACYGTMNCYGQHGDLEMYIRGLEKFSLNERNRRSCCKQLSYQISEFYPTNIASLLLKYLFHLHVRNCPLPARFADANPSSWSSHARPAFRGPGSLLHVAMCPRFLGREAVFFRISNFMCKWQLGTKSCTYSSFTCAFNSKLASFHSFIAIMQSLVVFIAASETALKFKTKRKSW